MGFLNSLTQFGLPGLFGGSNPAKKAMPYLNQIPGVAHQAYDPYIQQGQRQGNALESQYSQMFQDPTAFLNALQSGYKPSEEYNYKSDILGRGLQNTAAAGGFAGTQEHQRGYGELINQLLSGDMQRWLENLMRIQGTGLAGAETQAGRGYQASTGLADTLGSNLAQQGGLAYQGQDWRNRRNQAGFNSLANLGSSFFGGF
jgi:hypothetical protein